jgi:hypothetical protein
MSNIWGPMGWMTLHSISASYPDNPTDSDKAILNEYMNAFAYTIPCHICNTHFNSLFSSYKASIPSWANSKQDLFIAICRMHNAVNSRLDKPKANTVDEAIQWLKNAITYTSQADFKRNYLSYLFGQFNKLQPQQNSYVTKMKKITEEYWNSREYSYSLLVIPEENILVYKNQPVVAVFPKFKLANRSFRFKFPPQ